MQITQRQSLFDYLSSPDKGRSALSELASNTTRDTIQSDINTLSNPLGDDAISDLLDDVQSGDANVSLGTIGNLLEHTRTKLADDLQSVATNLGIESEVRIENNQGRWVVEQPDNDVSEKAFSRLQAYLDKSNISQNRLNQVSQLSEIYEQGAARALANDLKDANVNDDDIVDYLTETRQIIQANSGYSLSSKGLFTDADGVAKTEFDSRTESR